VISAINTMENVIKIPLEKQVAIGSLTSLTMGKDNIVISAIDKMENVIKIPIEQQVPLGGNFLSISTIRKMNNHFAITQLPLNDLHTQLGLQIDIDENADCGSCGKRSENGKVVELTSDNLFGKMIDEKTIEVWG